MLIEAVIENGQVKWLKPVQFVHDSFAVKVVIPDDEMAFSDQPSSLQNEEMAEFKRLSHALFGDGYRYMPEQSDQEILGDILSDKYGR